MISSYKHRSPPCAPPALASRANGMTRAGFVRRRGICRQPALHLQHVPSVTTRAAQPLPRSSVVVFASNQEPADAPPGPSLLHQAAEFGSIAGLFAVWYMSNIYFNIYNKQVLSAFAMPVTCTFIHLLVSCFLAIMLWVTRLKKPPAITPRIVDIVFPLAVLHMIGFWTTNASLGAVAVSLTHTIKALEPFFTVMLSWLLMGAKPAKRVLASLLPIVGGVVIASATDVSFNWAGFNAAMVSNLAFQSRNVLSKKAMLRSSYESLEGGASDTATLDEVNIFALMSIGAMLLMMPLVVGLDAPALLARSPNPAEWMSADLWFKTIMAGVCRFGDVLASFLILQRVIPVTHSVGNCVKRVVVIAASILFFKTPASFMNIIGTAVALSGVLIYSLVKRLSKDSLDAEKAVETTAVEDMFAAISPGTLYRKFQDRKKPAKADAPQPDDDAGLEYYL